MNSQLSFPALLQRVLISDRKRCTTDSLGSEIAHQAKQLGATAIMLREKDLESSALIDLATEIMSLVDLPLIVAHDPKAAHASSALGVHLGWTSCSIAEARTQLSGAQRIGVSVHGVEEGVKAAKAGADYLMLGAILPTEKAHGPYPSLGFGELESLCHSVDCPVIAVGGMNPQHEALVRSLGAAGWAAIRAFSISRNDS